MRVSADPRVGTELAGYRIESLLGWGGMSVVYLAEDLRLKRRVALKLLAARLADDDAFHDRFLRESELAASIDHPNIVPIYEAGTADGVLFIAMRYVEGGDLKERLQRGRMDPSDAIGIVAQVAIALDAAHARGLVHRDVKPSNILLDIGARPDGSDHVYLADFGLTKRVSDETGSGDGRLMGTIDYVAPEQIAGGEVDAMADVYSLGCVLFECLVGQPPFRRLRRESDMAVLFAHLDTQPPAASDERPDLPAALDAVIARALAKQPQQRYPGCREFARAAYAVAVDEASRIVVDVASRAATGRSDLTVVETELAGKVVDLQLMRDQARMLAAPPTPARLAAEGVCPFKGLANFEPVDADYFFGRERLVAELVARVVGAGFLGIVGPSGSGKSSVLRAGLLPALAGGVLPGSERWRRLLMRPGERPTDELRRVLVSGAPDPLAEALDALPADGRLLVAVDQLEELFTACRSDGERAAFTGALARAAADPRAVVVVALRADYYGRFATYPAFAQLLGANHVLVGPMQASELRRAVELPAGRVGLRAEPELVDALVDDVEGEPGALPLLSTALLELWQKRRDNTLAVAAYWESGRVHGAIARLAESVYERIADERKPLVRAIMLRLVGEGEGHAPVRRRAPLAELDLERNPDVASVLDTLADSRLVTIGERWVEVAHEALLREWPRLREWIAEDADWRRLRHHITEAATEWHAAGHDQGELYRGARLAAALDWAADHTLDLNELEREFITESREVAERESRRARRTNRRLRALLAGVVVLLAAAVTGGVLAAVQSDEARDAETAQLAQRLGAQALVEEDLDRSLLLARQAVAIDDSPQTRSYLLAGLLRAPRVRGVMHGDDDVLRAVAVSPDGSTIAVADFAAGVLFFDASSHERIGKPLPMEGGWVDAMAYSPDGKTLAIAGTGFIRLIDADTRKQINDRAVHSLVTRIAFTKDGTQVVAVIHRDCGDTWISIRDARTLRPVGPIIRPEGFRSVDVTPFCTTPFFALTPDGRSLITAAPGGELTWWDLESRRRTRTVTIEKGHHALDLSADGRTVAVGIDRGLQLVDVASAAVRSATGALTARPNWVRFSRDGRTVVSTGSDGTATLWDAPSATPRQTLRGHSAAVQEPVFSPDGAVLYTVAHDGTAIAWDVSGNSGLDRRFTFTHDRGPAPEQDEHPGMFSPDGRFLALGLKQRGIALRDATTLRRAGPTLRGTGGEVKDIAFTPDGRTLAAVTVEGFATVWDVGRRSRLRGPFRVSQEYGRMGLSISPDGTLLATAGGASEGVLLWDIRTGAGIGRIGEALWAGDVAFSPDGSSLALVRGIGGTVEIWELAGRSRTAVLTPPYSESGGYAVAFSPDGRTVASGGILTDVYLWDVRTGRLLRKLAQGSAGVVGLDFSPDGRLLAVAGQQPAASLWDVATGARIGPTLAAGDRRTQIDLSPDGRRLLVTHADGRGAIWNVDQSSWAQRACAVANRSLTRTEWGEFLPGRVYAPAC